MTGVLTAVKCHKSVSSVAETLGMDKVGVRDDRMYVFVNTIAYSNHP